jgi:hypothetical protein
MTEEYSGSLARAHQARDVLVEQFLAHPDVSLIDISYLPGGKQTEEDLVLRIHVRDQWMQASPTERVTFPSKIDGFAILIVHGDYQIESN